MKRFTARSLQNSWGSDESAKARARRGRWSTGPNELELEVFGRFLKKAIQGKENPKALVLGATTELRDIAIDYGCECLAVDLSPRLLYMFHNAMKHKESEKNHYMKGDWFKMEQFFLPESFDVVLADCSLNNIPAEDNNVMMRITRNLLRKGGYFISRSFVYCPERRNREIKEFIKEFNEDRNTPVGLFLEMAMHSKFTEIGLEKEKKEIFWEKIAEDIMRSVEKDIPEKEMAYIRNIGEHAKVHSSIVFEKDEFEAMLRNHFEIESIEMIEKYVYTKGMPIYVLKKKEGN
ncbi:methyltransferase domain-containing protein [Thermoproteota archaeon]